jgi:hypothetical protein
MVEHQVVQVEEVVMEEQPTAGTGNSPPTLVHHKEILEEMQRADPGAGSGGGGASAAAGANRSW